MSGRDRCEEILRMIDEALEDYDHGRSTERTPALPVLVRTSA